MGKNQLRKGLYFLTISTEYIHLVKNVVDENIKRGNIWMLSGDPKFVEEQYEEMTKWSDSRVRVIIEGIFIIKRKLCFKPQSSY